jgi:hypothetical protein
MLSLNLMAATIEETVRNIEIERNAHCVQMTRSIFSKCLGIPQTCFYNIKFNCFSETAEFKLKLKVVENYNGTVVRKSVISAK